MLWSLSHRLLLPGLVLGLLLNLLCLDAVATRLVHQFGQDLRQMQCAYFQALEKNMQEAQSYLAKRHRLDEDQTRVAVEMLLERWDPREDCPEMPLYPQKNPELPPDYPNWWIRWEDAP